MEIIIRDARESDMKAVLGLIIELAEYEKEPEAVINSEANLIQDAFGEDRLIHCTVAEFKGKVIGFFITYVSYSTWNGRCLYLEDLYVQEAYRRHGVGKMLFDELLCHAKEMGAKRLDWQVLDWNESAIKFYEKIGATIDKNWYNGRMFF